MKPFLVRILTIFISYFRFSHHLGENEPTVFSRVGQCFLRFNGQDMYFFEPTITQTTYL